MKQSAKRQKASDVPWPGPVLKTAYKEVCYVRHRDTERIYCT